MCTNAYRQALIHDLSSTTSTVSAAGGHANSNRLAEACPQEGAAMEPPRSQQQRKQDTLGRLETDADVWIATADTAGDAYLVPLSFLWDGTGVIVSTPRSSTTGRNL